MLLFIDFLFFPLLFFFFFFACSSFILARKNFFPSNKMHFLCAACRQCDRQRRVEKGGGKGGLGLGGGVFACIERIHLACLRLAEKSGKEITDDKEMSENSFQPAMCPPSTPLFFCCSVVFYSIFTISSILLRSKFLGLTHSAWFAAIICLHFARHPLLYFLYLSNLLLEHHPCQWLWDFLVFFYPFFC